MSIDHVGALMFPHALWMRMVGRLTFPIMAFLIAEGFKYTKNILKYELRLLLFALISAVPYCITFSSPYNVFFTLFGGLLALDIDKRVKNKGVGFVCMLLTALITYRCDWGFSGVITIYVFGKIKNKNAAVLFGVLVCIGSYLLKQYVLAYVIAGKVLNFKSYYISFYALFAIFPLMLYNGQRGYDIKGFFYIYYPLHLIIIFVLLNIENLKSIFI